MTSIIKSFIVDKSIYFSKYSLRFYDKQLTEEYSQYFYQKRKIMTLITALITFILNMDFCIFGNRVNLYYQILFFFSGIYSISIVTVLEKMKKFELYIMIVQYILLNVTFTQMALTSNQNEVKKTFTENLRVIILCFGFKTQIFLVDISLFIWNRLTAFLTMVYMEDYIIPNSIVLFIFMGNIYIK